VKVPAETPRAPRPRPSLPRTAPGWCFPLAFLYDTRRFRERLAACALEISSDQDVGITDGIPA
jgi:hypothetical protein